MLFGFAGYFTAGGTILIIDHILSTSKVIVRHPGIIHITSISSIKRKVKFIFTPWFS